MSRSYIHLPETVTVDIPNGGLVRSAGDEVFAPSSLNCTQTGVGFGPLYVGVPDGGGLCTLSRVSFLPGGSDEDGGGILFFGLTAGGAAAAASETGDASGQPAEFEPVEDSGTTRRDVLALAGATLAAAAVGPVRAAAQDDLAALHIAEVDIDDLNVPVTFRVLDVVDEVLPPTTEIMVDAQNTRVGEISEPSQGVTLPAGTHGTVKIYLRDSEGKLSRLLAWAKGVVGGDSEITFEREMSQKASNLGVGKFERLSEHPALVDPVAESGPSGTVLKIGNTRIPHKDEESSEVGSYGVYDDVLLYEAGENPPASAKWSLRTRLGRLAALSERYF